MKPFDHTWTEYCRKKLEECASASASVVTAVEQGGFIWRGNLEDFDRAIKNLTEAKALFLARREALETIVIPRAEASVWR